MTGHSVIQWEGNPINVGYTPISGGKKPPVGTLSLSSDNLDSPSLHDVNASGDYTISAVSEADQSLLLKLVGYLHTNQMVVRLKNGDALVPEKTSRGTLTLVLKEGKK